MSSLNSSPKNGIKTRRAVLHGMITKKKAFSYLNYSSHVISVSQKKNLTNVANRAQFSNFE